MIHLLKYAFIYIKICLIYSLYFNRKSSMPYKYTILLILIIIVSSLGKENCTLDGSVKIDFRSI